MNIKTLATYSFILFIIFFTVASLNAQTPPSSQQKKDTTKVIANQVDTLKVDSISKLPYTFKDGQRGSLFLNELSKFEVIYDPETKQYMFVEKIGDFYVKHPFYMTQKEYEEYRLQRDILSYFKDKISAVGGRKKDSELAQKNLLPKYYVNSSFFENIFGGNEIEVNPQGSVLIRMGILFQKVENPQLSERNRQSTTFDFDQEINASLNAKVGKRLRVNINFDTQSTFNFQNQVKLEFTPTEDDIIRKIEVGNVSMPIQSSLIAGAQNLFGVKTELQFGKTTVTGVFARQNSQTRSVAAQGGATVTEFNLRASDYDDNRHFFLSQSFRDDFNNALDQFPLINSSKHITQIEIWITNRNNTTEGVRNIVAFADLGEADQGNIDAPLSLVIANGGVDPRNEANTLDAFLTANSGIRNISSLSTTLSQYAQGTHYSVLENARKLVLGIDFTLNPQLGYITLNRRLVDSDVLAVAYEYTDSNIAGENVFRVGELSSYGVTAPDNLVVKLLRSEIINTNTNLWDLMMKNIYDIGAYQLQSDGFRLEVMYQDDATGVPLNILQSAATNGVKDKTLLNLLRLDRLDQSNNEISEGDGFFDFVESITINSQNGYVIFPTVQPFGSTLDNVLDASDDVFVFNELYNNTKAQAQNEFQTKDKYFLRGYFKSEARSGIPLGAFNVPRGSVTVTTGGRELIEGVDYVVDYQIGNVQIINPNLVASNAPINVSVENNNGFNQQQRRFMGIDIQHIFSENFAIGGTFLNLRERAFGKMQFGSEAVNNTIAGFNLNYQTEVPKFTKWVNKLPNIDTDVVSSFSIRAEAAYLLPGASKNRNGGVIGEVASYIDDFEGSQIPLDISSPRQWFLASVPQEQLLPDLQFVGDINDPDGRLRFGKKRSKLAWYTIDRLFYGNSLKPNNIDDVELSRAEVRQVSFEELFPEIELDNIQANIVNTFDLAYYPQERGSYNFGTDVNSEDKFINPESHWGGIMRSLNTTDFQQANVEYIQFWLMDPYRNYSINESEGGSSTINPLDFGGELYFNLGNISEDILNDDRRMYENGLPADGVQVDGVNIDPTEWSSIPKNQSLLYAFTEDDNERLNQDLGLDGIPDDNGTENDEESKFQSFLSAINGIVDADVLSKLQADPASDNYNFFRGSELDAADASILSRYRNFNRTQGNSPTINNSTESFPTGGTSFPDIEDINRDQTMSDVESYYQYRVSLDPNDLIVGQNNIIDKKEVSVALANGSTEQAIWYQFRIPVNTPDETIGGISDFNSIRFMRIFLTQFKIPVVLRFGELELVRGDWRRFITTIDDSDPLNVPVELSESENRNFEVGVVNIEENERKVPIPYVLPPGLERERLQGQTTIQAQNEQSLLIRLTDLPKDQTRIVFKNTSFDMRMFHNLKMFIHTANLPTQPSSTDDNDLTAIIRLGSDISDNYYQLELPLRITENGQTLPDSIWKNRLDVKLRQLGQLKLERLNDVTNPPPNELFPSLLLGPDAVIRVKGNPNLSNLRTLMLGVRNDSDSPKSAELWFNELRVTDFDNEGGWAAVLNADANFADFADISISGRASSQGFGSIDQSVNERSIEDVKQYDIVTNINLGQLLPKKAGIKIPFNYSIAEEFRDPRWDPLYQDVLFEDAKDVNPNSKNSRDYTKRRSINLINVRKERTNTEKKQHIYDIENVSVSYAYNETFHKDYNVERFIDQNVRASANYNYSFKPKSIEPLKNSKFLDKNMTFRFIKDFNINLLPTSISVNSNIIRSYNQQLSRPLIDDPTFPDLPELTQRRFMFDWDYNIAYNLTKSLQFTFRAANNYIYDVFENEEDITLFSNFLRIGRPNQYHQTLDATYKVPINKIPWFDFVNATYAYTADFDWQAASVSFVEDIGNTIQNANTHTLSADLDMTKFYKKTGILDLAKKKKKRTKKEKADAKKNKSKTAKPRTPRSRVIKNKTAGQKILQGLVDVVTSVKKIKIAYAENNGTILPGYRPEIGFLGRDNYSGSLAPTLGFVFGSQRDIRNVAIANNWLVTRDIAANDPFYSKNYSNTHFNKLDINVDVKPFKNLNIELSANRVFTRNQSQQLDVDSNTGQFNPDLPISEIGNFSISYFMLKNAFDGNGDATFEKFKNNRAIIAQRLASQAPTGVNPNGFGTNSQQVLLPAFLAAYSGKDASSVKLGAFRNIPIPNWRVNYKGLMKFKWFKKRFRSFTLEHRYRSTYSIIGFNNNLLFKPDAPFSNPDLNDNYQPEKIFTGVNLIEEFSPLLKVDMRMKNSFSVSAQVKRDKTLNLNMSNNTVTEIRGKEYIVGLGYRFKNVKFKMKTGNTTTTFKGDINLKADFGLRDNATVIRSIDIDNNQITGGQRLVSFKFIADYTLNKNLLASFFYDQNSSRFLISTTFPRKSINTGISIRYTIGN
ncbi:MAG: cell surface protein SprA [Flavobacteriaceae bacterium]|nr:cell surface protein SprA [Flavobacteriaceae bacterium]